MTTTTGAGSHEDTQFPSVPLSPVRILLRHADAGIRSESSEPDDWRALTPLGWRQARGVTGRLREVSVVRVFTSPALRCRQTVVPLARSLSADVEPRVELAIDANPQRLMEFLCDPETENAVLCTHRETLDRLFALVAGTVGRDRPVDGVASMGKAALWEFGLSAEGGQVAIRYLSSGAPGM